MILIFDMILRVIGILSIIWAIVSLFLNNKEFDTNIIIDKIYDVDLDQFRGTFFQDPNRNGEFWLLSPQNCNLKRVRFYSLKFEKNDVVKNQLLGEFKNINTSNKLLINSQAPCSVIPTSLIEWVCDYGVKGTYELHVNGKDGYVRMDSYFYKYTLLSKIRKTIGWK